MNPLRWSRLAVFVSLAAPLAAQNVTDPRITSWLADAAGNYARLYQSDAAKSAGTASTTWSRGSGTQSSPAYAGVTQVSYSSDWVYLRSTGLGYHTMGPWYGNAAHTQTFPNFPANTNVLYRLPRNPTVPATKTLTSAGAIGYGIDGVALFDNRDTYSYTNASGTDAEPGSTARGDGIWNREAYANEGQTFDPAYAHQAGAQYHYHANTPALRHLVGDHVDYDATTRSYRESATAVTKHSPILGWMADGYPIYGPYGYSSPLSAASEVRRLTSGYVLRNGGTGTTNLSATGRTTLPAWAQRAQNRTTLTAAQYGPAVSTTYALGHYLEDYDYLGDLGRMQGVDFDLDQFNGRFCVTPEFPSGTYAYFVTIEADGTPKFPHLIGRWFYGNPTGGAVTSVSETVTEYDRGAPAAALTLTGTASGSGVALQWNSAEGATYKLESSSDNATFATLSSSITSGGATTSYTTAATAAYFRVTLTAIATYDTNATVGTPVGTTATLHYTGTGSTATGATNGASTPANSTTTTTTTTPTTTTSPAAAASASSGGGGGGAPSGWFLAAFSLIAFARAVRLGGRKLGK